jgi:formate dehydrogenase iron-sulfur subunit
VSPQQQPAALEVHHARGWPSSYGAEAKPRMGFFTDTSVCIGCKACQVACKEWNGVPDDGLHWTGDSYDNTGQLDANTWRHVAFVEQRRALDVSEGAPVSLVQEANLQGLVDEHALATEEDSGLRWLMSSDVCKHCTEAACLDVCPTGAIFRTEFGTVVIQEDVCNGCGYCVVACPFGVITKREDDGRAWKCTLCYDRVKADLEPACAKACPTDSIQFGPLEDLLQLAEVRLQEVHQAGASEAHLYQADEAASGVGGVGAFFLLLDEPQVYGLPPDPVVTTRHLGQIWAATAAAAAAIAAGVAGSLVWGRRR